MLDPRRTALTVLFSIAAATSATAQGPQLRGWKASVLAEPQQRKPQAACAWLASLTRYEWSISTAVAVPQTAEGPEYCRVTGLIQPEVRFEVALPAVWNGRLLMFGNGGYAGEPLDQPGRIAASRSALARGFATALTNTDHDASVEPLGTFAVSPQKLVDYAYRAVHVTALTAKTILQAYYGGAAVHSYFYGCSTGGRQGLISAQRFPDDFDGIVVGAGTRLLLHDDRLRRQPAGAGIGAADAGEAEGCR